MPALPSSTHAIVVGVGLYPKGNLPTLHAPVEDALRFTQWLLDRDVPPAQIKLLLSRTTENRAPAPKNRAGQSVEELAATEASVRTAIHDLKHTAGDVLWFFWGGHGLVHRDRSLRLLYQDASEDNQLNLNLELLAAFLRTDFFTGAWSQQIFVADACRDFAWRDPSKFEIPGTTFPEGDEVAGREQFVMYGSSPGEFAYEEKAGHWSGMLSRRLQARLTKSSPRVWPPPMDRLASLIAGEFIALRKANQAFQTPTHFWLRDWGTNVRTFKDVAAEADRVRRPRADPVVAITPTAAATGRIAGLLAKHAFFCDPQQMESLGQLVPFAGEIDWQRKPAEYLPLLVVACFRAPRGFAAMLDAVQDLDEGALTPRFLEALDNEIVQPLKWGELMALKRLVASDRPDERSVIRAWAVVSRRNRPAWDELSTPLLCCLDHLAQDPVNRSDAPLFAFLQRLRDRLGQWPGIERWWRGVLQRQGVAAANLGAPVPTEVEADPVLVVLVTADSSDTVEAGPQDEYFVQGWVYAGATASQVFPRDEQGKPIAADDGGTLSGPDTPHPKSRLAEAIAALTRGARGVIGSLERLHLELIVPFDLLEYSIDDHPLPAGKFAQEKIGARWPILVRCHDRLVDPQYDRARDLWRGKWERLKQEWGDKGRLFWWAPGKETPEQLREALAHEPLAFYAAELVPQQGAVPRAHVIDAVLGAGIPVALWLHGGNGGGAGRRQKLAALLKPKHHLCPAAVLKQKKLALNAAAGPERLAFLWDSPERIPDPCNLDDADRRYT